MKTGRPKKYAEYDKVVKLMYPDITSRMGMNNQIYALIAMKIIMSKSTSLWPRFESSKGKKIKTSLLAELGRWENEKVIMKLAKEYANSNMTVSRFITASRSLRISSPRA